MNQCCFILENQNTCSGKCKYGNYCYKHRRDYLLTNDTIIPERFTGLSKDYLKNDLIKYRRSKMRRTSIIGSKEEIFEEIKNHITSLNGYYDDNNKLINIIKIQSLARGNISRIKLKSLNCNNEEDFYTYDLLKDIPSKYFYSYVDNKDIRWGFDIRSLEKLFQMGFPNPYTTEPVPENIKKDITDKIILLKQDPSYENLTDTIERDRKETIKQKIVDLFSFIEQSGYTCHIEWFTSLSVRRLKELYKQLEDIWNYRSQLNHELKCNICPPNADIFKTPMIEVMNYGCKEDLQELILYEVMKFTQALTDSDRKLGFMYFLISFGYVSQPCYHAHIDWLGFMMQNF